MTWQEELYKKIRKDLFLDDVDVVERFFLRDPNTLAYSDHIGYGRTQKAMQEEFDQIQTILRQMHATLEIRHELKDGSAILAEIVQTRDTVTMDPKKEEVPFKGFDVDNDVFVDEFDMLDDEPEENPNDPSVIKKLLIDARNHVLSSCCGYIVIDGGSGDALYMDRADRTLGEHPPKYQLGFLRLWLLGKGYRMVRQHAEPPAIRYRIVYAGDPIHPTDLLRTMVTDNPEILDPAEETKKASLVDPTVLKATPVCRPSHVTYLPYVVLETRYDAFVGLKMIVESILSGADFRVSEPQKEILKDVMLQMEKAVEVLVLGHKAMIDACNEAGVRHEVTGSAPDAGTRTSASGDDVRTAP